MTGAGRLSIMGVITAWCRLDGGQCRTGYRGDRLKGFLGRWPVSPSPFKLFSQFSKSAQTCKLKIEASLVQKIIKLCMGLDLNILNNFVNWVNLKCQIESML
jgi:hypothetical protein